MKVGETGSYCFLVSRKTTSSFLVPPHKSYKFKFCLKPIVEKSIKCEILLLKVGLTVPLGENYI